MISIIQGDITKIKADIIVNAANSSLLGGSGVDGAIHRAGGKTVLDECMRIRNKQGKCHVGDVVVTNAGHLDAKKIIHTVGPVWNGGHNNEKHLLNSCYIKSLRLAAQLNLRSIAFPNISTGIYKFPKELAATIAISVVQDFDLTPSSINEYIFVCFEHSNYKIYERLVKQDFISY